MTPEERYALISRNLQEVLGADNLKAMLAEGKTPSIYWGTATTGRPHVAYLLPMMKLADFLKAGCAVTVLMADLHACLDAMKTPWELLDHRVRYYEAAVRGLLKAVGVPLEKLRFVRGSEYQLSKEYTLDVYRLTSMTSQHDAKKAGAEVVKQSDHPAVSSLLYPLLQALDEEYLGVDGQFGGVDQRKIFTYAEKYLPHMGYKKRFHLMNPMVPGLTGGKMAASNEDSKIDLLDPPDLVKKKLKKAFCEPGNIVDNGVLTFIKYVVCPLLFDRGEEFIVERAAENGGTLRFREFEPIEKEFAELRLHPADLKDSLVKYVELFLGPLREDFADDADLQKSIKLAYPPAGKKPGSGGSNSCKPLIIGSSEDAEFFNSTLDIRVGRVVEIKAHPSAEHLNVVMIQVADATAPRNAVVPNALAASLATEHLVPYVHNLKPSKFRGHPSEALVLSAVASGDGGETEAILMAEGAAVGDRILALADAEADTFEGVQKVNAKAPSVMNPSKSATDKDKWAKLVAGLRVDDNGVAVYKDCVLVSRADKRMTVAKLRSTLIKL